MFTMYQLKIGLNQDKFTCQYKKDEKLPYKYPKDATVETLAKEKDLENVTALYESKFELLVIVYVIFDLYIIATQFLRYNTNLNKSKREQLSIISPVLLTVSVVMGIIILILVLKIRFSEGGKVCSGDYLVDGLKDTRYKDLKDYFMY